VVWPCYFDKRLSRKRGRRVPLKLSTENPTVEMISGACKRLGLDFEASSGAHPRTWWRKTGFLIVRTSEKSKPLLIKRIAEAMRKHG